MCGNMKFIASVDQNIFVNTRDKFRISVRPCIVLLTYIKNCPIILQNSINLNYNANSAKINKV
jgi:hypothetical protein